MNKHAEYTEDRLRTIGRARARHRAASCLLGGGGLVLGLLLAFGLLDYRLLLPAGVRALGTALLAGLLGIGVINLWRMRRARVSLKRLSLELEERRPELGCLLSTAAEYIEGHRARDNEYSPELVAGLQEQTARRLLQIETDWYRRETLRGGAYFAGVAMLAAAFLFAVPAAGTAFLRTVLPWRDLAYTAVEVAPGDVEVALGRGQVITAGFAGRQPEESRLEWKPPDGSGWQAVSMARRNEEFVYSFEQLHRDLLYRVRGAQASSREYRITTFVPPELRDVLVEVEYPAYTGIPPARLRDPDLTAVRGSRLKWTFAVQGDIQQARLRFAARPDLELKPAGAGAWSGELAPKEDFYYWVDLADDKGRKGGNERPYRVTLLPDEKPRVTIIEPGLDIRSDPGDLVRLKIAVFDDFGLTESKLVVRKMDGQRREYPLPLEEGVTESQLETTLDLAPFNLQPYELLSYYVEAADNNSLDGPGIGRSPVYFIEYTTGEEALSQCVPGGDGTRINLLVLQKQIIASTLSIPEENPPDRYADIAAIQRQTRKYADVFSAGFLLALAPPKAREEFDAARERMDRAVEELEGLNRRAALRHEEAALQHLYAACRLLPELEAGMCRGEGDCIQIVMEEIKKLKEEEQKEREATLRELLAEIKKARRQQAALNDIFRKQAMPSPAQSGEPLSGEDRERPGARGQSAGREDAMEQAGRAVRESHNQFARGNGDESEERTSRDARGLSEEQRAAAERASGIARRLMELSGRDARVSHAYARSMWEASEQLREAARQAGHGAYTVALNSGSEGFSILGEVIFALERIYEEGSVATDLAAEEYPKVFEAKINAYLKTLSYAE